VVLTLEKGAKTERSLVLRRSPEQELVSTVEDELLKLYLRLPDKARQSRFLDTSRAAEMAGLSRRTIQFWVETGLVNAILVGRRYQIELKSLIDHIRESSRF
jgi:hypothetical protein